MMVASRHLLIVLCVQANFGALAAAMDSDAEGLFLDSLMEFKQQYQRPESHPAEPPRIASGEEIGPGASLGPSATLSRPGRTTKHVPQSPYSKRLLMDFRSSAEYRPFKGSKVVHSKYFFVPEQVNGPRVRQYHVALPGENTLSKRHTIRRGGWRPTARTYSASLVEHILIDSSILLSVVCPHMRHDFISDEPVPGKFNLVSTKILPFRLPKEEEHPAQQGLFFPSNFANPFAYSYASRLVVSVAYIAMCLIINLVFSMV